MGSLAIKYRPKTFGEVVGQEQPVQFLRGLIARGRLTRHILLHGSIGSGKTTLARIYAKALNCEAITADSSPCLTCQGCIEVDEGDKSRFVELDAPSFEEDEHFTAVIHAVTAAPVKAGRRQVIFIDEAHSLRRFRGGFDFLLKRLEDSPEEVSYVFATTEPDAIPRTLKSRMSELKIRPLFIEEGKAYLKDIAKKEGFEEVEDEALSLICGLGEGQPRNMLQAFDQVAMKGEITRGHVRNVFDVDDVEALVAYFVALGEGDVSKQSKLFSAWSASIQKKVSWIQGLLVSIYYNDLMKHPVDVEPVISSIKPLERAPILEAFRRRLPDDRTLMRAWREMLMLLPVDVTNALDEGLLAQVILFQDHVSSDDLGARPVLVKDELDIDDSRSRKMPVRSRGGNGRTSGIEKDPNYLTSDTVARIYNVASAFTQAYGLQFNLKITVSHDAFGCIDLKSAGKNAGSFTQALSQRFQDWFGRGDRMLVQEVDPRLGPCARVIACVPDASEKRISDLKRWLEKWRLGERSATAEHAIQWEILRDQTAMNVHWACVRWLCGGLNPQEPLHAELGLIKRVAGDIGSATRYAASASCGPDLRESARNCGLPFFSAINGAAWPHLYSGWELEISEGRRTLDDLHGEGLATALDRLKVQEEALRSRLGLGVWNAA